MPFILGQKLGMSQVFQDDGTVIPVTLLSVKPVTIKRLMNKEKNGYSAVQISLDGVFKRPILKEFRVPSDSELKPGDKLDVSNFNEGDLIKVASVSKGKGFQGGVKRHNFRGMPASHGHKHVTRTPGSIGQRFPQHTLKGTRMAGHMGHQRVTIKNLRIFKIDSENETLIIKGAIPGRRGAIVEITT